MLGRLMIMKISLLLYEKYLSSTSLETRRNLGRVSSCNHLNGNVSWDDNGTLFIFLWTLNINNYYYTISKLEDRKHKQKT